MRFERSLVVLKNYLGDSVMASPLVRSVAAISGATDVLGAPVVEQIFRFPNFRARFYDPGNLSKLGQLLRMVKRVREGKYEVAFIVNRSFRSALLAKLAGIPKRVGHATEGRGWLLTDRVPYHPTKNEALCYLDLLQGAEPDFTKPELFASDEERERGKELLSGATIGIQPGARHEYKQIPIPVWQAVGRRLIDQGGKLAFIGGVEERGLLGELQLPGVDLIGRTTLRETIGVVANLELMIGGDTGVMHLAAGAGTPTITVFGPTPSEKWGWFESPHQVIIAPDKDIQRLEASTLIEAAERVTCALP
ncbi:MAG: glycosyltransferase family 9 protein [Chlorobia bacterium]|nr:glycosyltransferase family 9 protein [Fimbriimonadaceae bacterium]